jgi:hypothetical protein
MGKEFKVERHMRTYNNPKGICAITSRDNIKVLATLGHNKGELVVYNSFLDDESTVTPFDIELQSIEISSDVFLYVEIIGVICLCY